MRKLFSLISVFILLLAIAQDDVSERRIISIESNDGTQSGNIRFGPIIYEHPEPDGVVATVSTLTIFSSYATLRGPETAEGEDRMTLAQAQGQRTATFTEGVQVERGRLSATGPDLFYSEEEGLGDLTGGVEIEVAPRQPQVAEPAAEEADTEDAEEEAEGDSEAESGDAEAEANDDAETEPVFITADEAEFDVDTDVSISRGNVNLINGNQTAQADEIEYEEERTLGVLRGNRPQVVRVDEDGNELTITADEIRAETDSKRLYAVGNAVVIDGGITTTGDEVFFDDEQQLAEIVGDPAESVDEDGATVRAPRIQQDIEFDVVEPMNAAQESGFSADEFLLTRENE